MGLSAVLEKEDGSPIDRVDDPTNVLHTLLPGPNDREYPLIGLIDWYGDTIFNYLQAKPFLDEWRRMGQKATNSEGRAIVEGIQRLAERLLEERHVYLKFYGD